MPHRLSAVATFFFSVEAATDEEALSKGWALLNGWREGLDVRMKEVGSWSPRVYIQSVELTHEQFVMVWQTSQTLTEVCKKAKIGREHASEVATRLRKHGVELKKFRTGTVKTGLQSKPKDSEASKKRAIDSKPTGEEENMSQPSLSVVGLVPPDSAWNKMKTVWDACQAAGIAPPKEVYVFFEYGEPDESGVIVKIESREFNAEMAEGLEVDLASIPSKVKTIRFRVDY